MTKRITDDQDRPYSDRLVKTSSGRFLVECHTGRRRELPTVCVEYERMPDGWARVIREYLVLYSSVAHCVIDRGGKRITLNSTLQGADCCFVLPLPAIAQHCGSPINLEGACPCP